MDAIKENWTTVKEAVRREYSLSDISYHTWVEPLEFHNVVNDVVSIIIPSDQAHALNYISSKYKSFFQVTITEMFDHPYDINFILEKDVKAEEPAENEMAVPNQIYGINYEDAHLNPKYKFDTFVVEVITICSFRIPCGSGISGRSLQSSLFIWRSRSGQDSPDAFHRTFYFRTGSGQKGSLRYQ